MVSFYSVLISLIFLRHRTISKIQLIKLILQTTTAFERIVCPREKYFCMLVNQIFYVGKYNVYQLNI